MRTLHRRLDVEKKYINCIIYGILFVIILGLSITVGVTANRESRLETEVVEWRTEIQRARDDNESFREELIAVRKENDVYRETIATIERGMVERQERIGETIGAVETDVSQERERISESIGILREAIKIVGEIRADFRECIEEKQE